MFLFLLIFVSHDLAFDDSTQMNHQQYEFHVQLHKFPASKWDFRRRRDLYQSCGYFPRNGPEVFCVNRILAKQWSRQDFHGVNFSHYFSASLRFSSSRLKNHGDQASEMMLYSVKLSPFFCPQHSKEASDLTLCCFHAFASARQLCCISRWAPTNTEQESWRLLQPHKEWKKEGRKQASKGRKFSSLLFQTWEEAQSGESVFTARVSLSFLHCRIALRELIQSRTLPLVASGTNISERKIQLSLLQ